MKSTELKTRQLGMPFGTASNKLRKLILFKYIKMAGEDMCFKCGKKISIVDDLSIEHKIPWQGKTNDLFWNLDNIAFSHLKCNKRSLKWLNGRPHGNRDKYGHEGCRCDICRKSQMDYQRSRRNFKRTRNSEARVAPS